MANPTVRSRTSAPDARRRLLHLLFEDPLTPAARTASGTELEQRSRPAMTPGRDAYGWGGDVDGGRRPVPAVRADATELA